MKLKNLVVVSALVLLLSFSEVDAKKVKRKKKGEQALQEHTKNSVSDGKGPLPDFVTITHLPPECELPDALHVQNRQNMTLHFRGWISEKSKKGEPGHEFINSYNKTPLEVTLGIGMLLKGWEHGLQRLCPGEKRHLLLEPDWAYGEMGAKAKGIPPGATVEFDIECVSVDEALPEDHPDLFGVIDTNKDNYLSMSELDVWFMELKGEHIPEALVQHDDKNGDEFIFYDEFSGTKGDGPPNPDIIESQRVNEGQMTMHYGEL